MNETDDETGAGGPISDAELDRLLEGVDPKHVTINDIARLASVSKKTVSRVINDSPLVREGTRSRVKSVIERLNFRPDPRARALAFSKSFLVGMVYDNPSPQYVVNMQRGILDGLLGTPFQLVLNPVDRGDDTFHARVRDFIVQQKPYGLILSPSVSEDEALIDMLREENCDYVRIASVELDTPQHMIRTLDAEGGAEAARHLVEKGHTRIGHIHGPWRFRSAHERLSGFRKALAEAGIELPDAWMQQGSYTFDSGVECGLRLLSSPDRPTAIFAGNDEMANGIYVAARRLGLSIPDDVSVVGFDDSPMAARVWPGLTTVRLPIRDMGQSAARLLLSTEARAKLTHCQVFMPEIVVRQSVATRR